MMKVLRKKRKGGFTLIELIVVIAIIGILAAIAIPRFAGIQTSSRVKADASTAKQILTSARVYEAANNSLTAATLTDVGTLMTVPTTAQSGGNFALVTTTATDYKVTWGTGGTYSLTEAGVLDTTP